MANVPFVQSAVNGIRIPLHPHQAGILHRFSQPENRLVISRTSETGGKALNEPERMVLDSIPESELNTQAAPQSDASAELRADLIAMQEQLQAANAALQAANAALQAQAPQAVAATTPETAADPKPEAKAKAEPKAKPKAEAKAVDGADAGFTPPVFNPPSIPA